MLIERQELMQTIGRIDLTDNDWKKFRAEEKEYANIRDYIMARAEEAGINERDRLRLELGVEEVVINVIHYAYEDGGDLYVRTSIDDGKFTIELVDHGIPFNPLEKHDERAVDTSDIEDRKLGGFGIEFMRKKFSKVEYSDEPFMGKRANRLSMTFEPKGLTI